MIEIPIWLLVLLTAVAIAEIPLTVLALWWIGGRLPAEYHQFPSEAAAQQYERWMMNPRDVVGNLTAVNDLAERQQAEERERYREAAMGMRSEELPVTRTFTSDSLLFCHCGADDRPHSHYQSAPGEDVR